MKALVLGCGEMGEAAVRDLYEYGDFDKITVGTRSLEKATGVISTLEGRDCEVVCIRVDASARPELTSLMTDFDVVINCVGPNYKYERVIAESAIDARVDLVDVNDEFETTFEMLALDEKAREAGVTVILGLGASPGVNNILARAAANQLEEVDEIHTAWVMSGSDPGGLALSYHLLYSLSGKGLTFEDGEFVEIQSFRDGRERIDFPEPVGPLDVFHIGHPEPITLARTFPGARCIDDKATFKPAFINDLIVRLGTMVREADGPIRVNGFSVDPMDFAAAYLHQKCKGLKGVDKDGALRVAVKGTRRGKPAEIVFSSAGRLAMGTGIPASIGAIMLARGRIGKRGVLPPEECIEPNDFLYEILNRRNVAKLNGWLDD